MADVVNQARLAHTAALELQGYSSEDKNKMLSAIADGIFSNKKKILQANSVDLDKFPDKNSVFYERLTLNDVRINAMIDGIKQIIELPDPIGQVTDSWTRPSGIKIKKVRAPLGVIAIIYEARPNVTVDAASLCIKSGNAVILRGSKGAINSNRILYNVMRKAIADIGFNSEVIQFIDDEKRESVFELLQMDNFVDVVIPRGGEGLKNFILQNSKIPVIASAGGNCHIYVEETADLDKALDLIINAKCQRPSVCNAAEHILIDKSVADVFVRKLYKVLSDRNVEVLGDTTIKSICDEIELARDDDYDTEFEALKITLKTVNGVIDAVNEINKRGTRHSEAIFTNDDRAADYFQKYVDAAAIYVNVSTRFTDGYEYGFGAEMGISTGKIHARGPIGLNQLTSEKYVVSGNYVIRK